MSRTPYTISYPTVAIIGKPGATGIERTLLELAEFLQASGRRVVFEAQTASSLSGPHGPGLDAAQIGKQADVAVVVGGDGTMLGIARQLAPFNVPLIGINQGRLGFITDIAVENLLPALNDVLEGKAQAEQRTLLEGTVLRNGVSIFEGLAFNDVVVARGTGSGMVELRVDVDGGGVVRRVMPNGSPPSDPRARSVYEAARRALLDPRCNPLPLPATRLAALRDTIFRFNPRDLGLR